MTEFSQSIASSNWFLRELARWPKTLKIGTALMLLIVSCRNLCAAADAL